VNALPTSPAPQSVVPPPKKQSAELAADIDQRIEERLRATQLVTRFQHWNLDTLK